MGVDEQLRKIAEEIADTFALTFTETLVLRYILEGHGDKVIGEKLENSYKTIKNHVAAILTKMEMGSRSEVQAYALRKMCERYNEIEGDMDSIYVKWTSLEKEMDKRKSRNFAELQHASKNINPKKDNTKDLDKKQSEHLFESGKKWGEERE